MPITAKCAYRILRGCLIPFIEKIGPLVMHKMQPYTLQGNVPPYSALYDILCDISNAFSMTCDPRFEMLHDKMCNKQNHVYRRHMVVQRMLY